MSFISKILQMLGENAASVGAQGCWLLIMDEPKAPKNLVKK